MVFSVDNCEVIKFGLGHFLTGERLMVEIWNFIKACVHCIMSIMEKTAVPHWSWAIALQCIGFRPKLEFVKGVLDTTGPEEWPHFFFSRWGDVFEGCWMFSSHQLQSPPQSEPCSSGLPVALNLQDSISAGISVKQITDVFFCNSKLLAIISSIRKPFCFGYFDSQRNFMVDNTMMWSSMLQHATPRPISRGHALVLNSIS